MRYFFTSDTHFFHSNIIKYSKRPYTDLSEMHEALITNWNSVVTPQDIIFHLGDFSFGTYEKTKWVLSRLNGNINFCFGNHDQIFKKHKDLTERFNQTKDYFELKFKKKDGSEGRICMSHFPMVTWNKAHHGSYMLHGHCHGSMKYPFKGRIMDVGVDPCNYFPISLEEVEERMERLDIHTLDHHKQKMD